MATLNPYLNFDDKTEEAFNFYKAVFGGEFSAMMRFKEMPGEYPVLEEEKEKIMHIALPIGGETILMGSDSPSHMGPVVVGNNISISISAKNREEAEKFFQGLSAGGKEIMPLEKAFWGAYFGMITDKFGVQWMVSAPLEEK